MSNASTVPLHRALGLTDEEFADIGATLGRAPSHAELAMFSVMWSEHCSYKSSRVHLRDLPTSAPWLVVGPGENAGVVEAAPGLRIAFKIESHNHPSAVEPFQGAATGVGGIVRDIVALGARPVALLDPLRFGPLSEPRNRYLFDGVVRGIASYGNALGLPTVGGEAVFDPCYTHNPLVNVMCVGVVQDGDVLTSGATAPGQLAVLFGSRTGRDGIGGASILASREFEDGQDDMRPAVQVGDPFTEKLLIEACLEMKREGVLAALQDLGAAGITCALAETAAKNTLGVEADLDRVPLREPGMEAWEILMSESQERMLAILPEGRLPRAVEICAKWGLDATVIGRYTSGGRLAVEHAGARVADVPAAALDEGVIYHRPMAARDRSALAADDTSRLPWPALDELLLAVLASPTIASKAWVWRQYDHMVRLNALTAPGAGGAVLRLPEESRPDGRQTGIVLSTDGPGRIASLDPYAGGALAVFESARNVATMGARPLAITNCLNFGSPERPEVMADFAAAVRGIADACRALQIPVTGGNVSFYNEAPGAAVHPTPIVGMLGVLDDAYTFRKPAGGPGDDLILLGTTRPELGGSEALAVAHGLVAGLAPVVDPDAEVALIRLLSDPSLGTAAQDCSEGGLAVALAELALASGCGLRFDVDDGLDPVAALFSESTARAVLACEERHTADVLARARSFGVPAAVAGRLGGEVLEVGPLRVGLDEARAAFTRAIDDLMSP